MQISYAELKEEVINWQEKWALDNLLSLEISEEHSKVSSKLSQVLPEDMVKVQIIAKRHIENWRIHSFDDGFLSMQALNKNLFDSKNILQNLKIRISSLYGDRSIEFSRKGNFESKEISLIENCLEHFHKPRKEDPIAILTKLGCSVFLPKPGFGLNSLAGYSVIKEKVEATVIFPLKYPDYYNRIAEGTRLNPESIRPKGVLFSGPPGVGKTTMARAIGSEASIPLVYIPLENIMSSYYGESSRRLATIFDTASCLENAILFLDEIDGLVQARNDQMFEATRRILSVLLRKLEGLEDRSGVIVVGATNRKTDLDPALISRFDSDILFPLPDIDDIDSILMLYAKQLNASDRKILAKRILGKSPRAIKDICTLTERNCVRQNLQDEKNKLPILQDYLDCLEDYSLEKNKMSSSIVSSS